MEGLVSRGYQYPVALLIVRTPTDGSIMAFAQIETNFREPIANTRKLPS